MGLFNEVESVEVETNTIAVLYDVSGSVRGPILKYIQGICAMLESMNHKITWIAWNNRATEVHYKRANAGGFTDPDKAAQLLNQIESSRGIFHTDIILITDGQINSGSARTFSQSMNNLQNIATRNLYTILTNRFSESSSINKLNGVDASISNVLFSVAPNSVVYASSITEDSCQLRPIMGSGTLSQLNAIDSDTTYGSLPVVDVSDILCTVTTNVPQGALSDGKHFIVLEEFYKLTEVDEEVTKAVNFLNDPAFYPSYNVPKMLAHLTMLEGASKLVETPRTKVDDLHEERAKLLEARFAATNDSIKNAYTTQIKVLNDVIAGLRNGYKKRTVVPTKRIRDFKASLETWASNKNQFGTTRKVSNRAINADRVDLNEYYETLRTAEGMKGYCPIMMDDDLGLAVPVVAVASDYPNGKITPDTLPPTYANEMIATDHFIRNGLSAHAAYVKDGQKNILDCTTRLMSIEFLQTAAGSDGYFKDPFNPDQYIIGYVPLSTSYEVILTCMGKIFGTCTKIPNLIRMFLGLLLKQSRMEMYSEYRADLERYLKPMFASLTTYVNFREEGDELIKTEVACRQVANYSKEQFVEYLIQTEAEEFYMHRLLLELFGLTMPHEDAYRFHYDELIHFRNQIRATYKKLADKKDALGTLFKWCRKRDGVVSRLFMAVFGNSEDPIPTYHNVYMTSHEALCRRLYADFEQSKFGTINEEIAKLDEEFKTRPHYVIQPIKPTNPYKPMSNYTSCECGCGSSRSSNCRWYKESLYSCDYCSHVEDNVKRSDYSSDVQYNIARYNCLSKHLKDVYSVPEGTGYMFIHTNHARQTARYVTLDCRGMSLEEQAQEVLTRQKRKYGKYRLVTYTRNNAEFIVNALVSFRQ